MQAVCNGGIYLPHYTRTDKTNGRERDGSDKPPAIVTYTIIQETRKSSNHSRPFTSGLELNSPMGFWKEFGDCVPPAIRWGRPTQRESCPTSV